MSICPAAPPRKQKVRLHWDGCVQLHQCRANSRNYMQRIATIYLHVQCQEAINNIVLTRTGGQRCWHMGIHLKCTTKALMLVVLLAAGRGATNLGRPQNPKHQDSTRAQILCSPFTCTPTFAGQLPHLLMHARPGLQAEAWSHRSNSDKVHVFKATAQADAVP